MGATGGIGVSVATAAGGARGNGDGECDGNRAQSSGVVVGGWEASMEGDRAAVVATNKGGSCNIADAGQSSVVDGWGEAAAGACGKRA